MKKQKKEKKSREVVSDAEEKVQEEGQEESNVLTQEKEEPEKVKPAKKDFDPTEFKEKPQASIADRIAESRKALDEKLDPHQKLFESPDGEIIIGDADKDKAWSRTMNDGKGGWANPKR